MERPETQVSPGQLKKFLVVALFKDEANRRAVEDEMAMLLKRKSRAILYMRLVDVDKEVTYTPGTLSRYPVYYRTLNGYYIQGWEYYSTPSQHPPTSSE